jgi:transposase
MASVAQQSPKNLEAALASAHGVIATLSEKLQATLRENELLRQKIDALCRRIYGKGSEKVSAEQLALAFAQLPPEDAPAPAPVAPAGSKDEPEKEGDVKPARRKPTGRRPFPENLPRKRTTVEPSPEELVCHCGCEKTKISEKVNEKVNYTPASVFVEETVRPVYGCPKCHDGITVAPPPPQALEGSAAGSGLLAHIIVSKYVDHLPLYRLERIFERMGLRFSRSTMCGLLAQVEALLAPLGEEIIRRLRAGPYLQFDDTSVRVLTEEEQARRFGRVWVYLSPLDRLVAFDATATREHGGPLEFLEGFSGYLQGDGYSGNLTLRKKAPVFIVGCMTHLRRYFVEALETDPRAAHFIAFIKRLYVIEEAIRDLTPAEKRAARQAEAKPILREMSLLGRAMEKDVLPKSPLGEALTYLRNQARYVYQYIRDGRLEIDNNGAERQLRGVAVGRKNWLFAGSMNGLRRAALLYSLVQSCKLVGVEPWAYLRDVLDRLPTHPQSRIGDLLPKEWAAARAAAPDASVAA